MIQLSNIDYQKYSKSVIIEKQNKTFLCPLLGHLPYSQWKNFLKLHFFFNPKKFPSLWMNLFLEIKKKLY